MTDTRPDLSSLRRDTPTAPAMVPPPARRWKTRVLLPVGVIVLFALVFLVAGWDALAPRLEVRVVPVVVKRGAASAGSVAFQASGWIEPDPFPVYASALTDGVVEELLVLEGQRVKAGDVVARLVQDDARLALERAAARLDDLTARVAVADAELTAAQLDWDNPVERERAVAVAKASLAGAKAERVRLGAMGSVHDGRVAELREQLKRDEQQLPERAITEWEVVRTRLRLGTAEAALAAVIAEAGGATARVAEAEAELRAASENLRLRTDEKLALQRAKARLAQMQAERAEARAQRDEAQLRLDRTEVRAPADGVVMNRLAAPGTKLMLGMDGVQSAHVVHLYDPAKLQVRVDIPLADAAGAGVGQKAEIVPDVLPDRTFQGVVTRIVHEADIQKNTLQVKVAIADPAPELKPEMLARVRFFGRAAESDTPQIAERVFAPERLIRRGAGGPTVWIVDEGRREAALRPVQLGTAKQGDWVEIASGLNPGDALIDGAPEGLSDGDAVRVVGESR